MAEKLLQPANGLSYSKIESTTAERSDVLTGKTFYSKLKTPRSGTMENRGAWTGIYFGSNITIPAGYHNGSGYVTVSGGNQGKWTTNILPGTAVPIPEGYHNGAGWVAAYSVQNSLKTASFNLSIYYEADPYGGIQEKWWSPGGTVIGMIKCDLQADTQSGEQNATDIYCEVSNGQVHFVVNYTHRGGWTYAEGTVVYI